MKGGGSMKISLAHSPDSDDAFMFYGLARGKVDTGGLEVAHVMGDIESLNRAARERRHEVTALSFHAYPYVADGYALMPCGGSIGDGYGPLVVAREALATAIKALDTFENTDRRARGYVQSGQELTASDLIFADSLRATSTIATELDAARLDERARAEAAAQQIAERRLHVLLAAAAICLVAVLLLVPRVPMPRPRSEARRPSTMTMCGTPPTAARRHAASFTSIPA